MKLKRDLVCSSDATNDPQRQFRWQITSFCVPDRPELLHWWSNVTQASTHSLQSIWIHSAFQRYGSFHQYFIGEEKVGRNWLDFWVLTWTSTDSILDRLFYLYLIFILCFYCYFWRVTNILTDFFKGRLWLITQNLYLFDNRSLDFILSIHDTWLDNFWRTKLLKNLARCQKFRPLKILSGESFDR